MTTISQREIIDGLNISAFELNRKDPKKAIELSREAMQLAEAASYIPGKAQALLTLGISNVWISNNEEAFTNSILANQLFSELGDKISQAKVAYNIGTNFFYLSDYDNAFRYYSQCYQLNEEAGHESGIAEGLNGLGTVYYTIEQNEKALEVLLRAKQMGEQSGEYNLLARILDGLGEACYNLGRFEEALEKYFGCLDALRKGDAALQVESYALDGIGRSYTGLGEFKKAFDYYEASLKIRREIGFRVGESASMTNMGKLLLKMGKPEEANAHLLTALEIAGEINSREGIYQAGEALAGLGEKIADFEMALKYYKIFHEAKEKVRDEKSRQRSKSIEMQFKMEQAESERKLLEKKNSELQSYFNDVVQLSEIGQKITSSLSVDEIVETVYENVNRLMDATGFGIGLLEPDGKTLVFPVYVEDGEWMKMIRYDLQDKNRLAVWCLENGEEIFINHFPTEVNRYIQKVQKPLAGKQISSLIYLPLLVKGKVLGVITVQSFNANAYNVYHLNMLRSIGVNASIALENAMLYRNVEATVLERTHEVVAKKEEVERAYENTRLLSEIGQQLTSAITFEAIFSKLHESVNRLMDAACFGVRIYHPERNEVEYKFEMENDERLSPMVVSMEDRDNYSVWCVSNKKEIFINDNLLEYSKYTKQIRVVDGEMPHSLIFFPLMIGEKVLGVITVQSFKRNAYKPYHLDILKTLASYTAIAFENANLYESLEDKVKERTAEVMRQKEVIEEKNKDITDSIKYAKKIQQAILPANQEILKDLPQSFIFYKPKDIVSGDFYWYASLGDNVVFAVADCTGHGVPGAFMSAICNDLMNQVIRDGRVTSPGMALQLLDIKLRQLLNKSAEKGANDGMDIALCTLNIRTNVLQYSGAHRPLLVMRNGEAMEFRADRHSIGGYNTGRKQFTDHEIALQKNDILYLFTDGYTDQFGGPKGKKFKYSKLKELLVEIESLALEEQYKLLDESIEGWRKDHEQVDDILLFGVRI